MPAYETIGSGNPNVRCMKCNTFQWWRNVWRGGLEKEGCFFGLVSNSCDLLLFSVGFQQKMNLLPYSLFMHCTLFPQMLSAHSFRDLEILGSFSV